MSSEAGSYESKGREKEASDSRRLGSPKSPGLSPRGPRPVKSSTSERLSTQSTKTTTEPPNSANDSSTNGDFVTLPTPLVSPTLEPLRQSLSEPTRSATPTSISSGSVPASKLWDNVRHHVLNPSSRPSTPSQPTSRSGTPKHSRFPKSSLKQVAEGVGSINGDLRKISEDILRACNIARYGETVKPSKEKEAGASYQPANISGRRLDYLRRPLSIASISSTNQSSSAPSLRYLYQLLVHYSTSTNTNQIPLHFPHETRVLSTLLCPFLSQTNYPASRLEEEQLTAMDAFELLSNSWDPADEAVLNDRLVWCSKAAATMSSQPAKTRLLTASRKQFLSQTEGSALRLPVHSFRALISQHFLLLASLHMGPALLNDDHHGAVPKLSSPPSTDLHLVQDSIKNILTGSLEIDEQSIVDEYATNSSSADGSETLKEALSIEALLYCTECCPGPGEWMLLNIIEKYWRPFSDQKFTSLQGKMCLRRNEMICHISQYFLQMPFNTSPNGPLPNRRKATTTSTSSLDSVPILLNPSLIPRIVSVLKKRVLPEIEALSRTDLDEKTISNLRAHVIRLLLELTAANGNGRTPMPKDDVFGGGSVLNSSNLEHVKWAVSLLAGWYRAGTTSPWGAVFEETLRQQVQAGWRTCVPILMSLLKNMPEGIKKNIIVMIFPFFNDQLVNDPPPHPFPEMSTFLTSLSRTFPPLFYKPLFACAASDKEVIVVNHFCTIQVHSKYVEDYWTRDPEMLCVALLSDIGMADKGGNGNGKWAKGRLGQLVLLTELIGKIQFLRIEKETESDSNFTLLLKFLLALETRLWKMIEAKEKILLIPPSQRMLLCMLLRELRLTSRSLKPAPWLSVTLEWFHDFCANDHIGELDHEVTESIQRVQGLYSAGQSGVQQVQKRHISTLASSILKATSNMSTDDDKILDLGSTFMEHKKLVDSLSKGYIPRAIKLFVTLSVLISTEDYRRLGATLWQHCLLDNADTSATASACFLLMRCAEKTPMDILPVVEIDLHASDDMTRLEAVRKFAVVVNLRFQISTQNILTDRSHRPFKLGRPPLPFVATDLGSSLYIPTEEVTQNRDKDGVPLELRKRLEELGWVEEDANAVDPRLEIIQAPLSILSFYQMEAGTGDAFVSPLPTPQPSPRRNDPQQTLQNPEDSTALLRRNSSSGGAISNLKRRAVFVPSLSSIFEHLCKLVFDPNLSISSAARTTLLDSMRSDPALLSRNVLDQLAGENKDVRFVISTFSALLHVRCHLPPPLAHYLFNNLAGFLKYVMKHVQISEALVDFGQVMPVITRLAIQVSGMSMRDIRRSKMEYIFTPSGSLWFSSAAPKSAMFPRMLEGSIISSQNVPSDLLSISLVRTSQNLFFLTMLKRNYKDVQAVRKSMSTLVLPSSDEASKSPELRDFAPIKNSSGTAPYKHGVIDVLSLMVARSHIILVGQIFRSLPRHLSDRSELSVLFDGLNKCLLAHSDDMSTVSHVLIALMVASARFRRLFLTGAGYVLFMPALVKVYTEQHANLGIRSAIEYAISRFYVLHKEAFLYQSIHIIGQLAMLAEVEPLSFSRGVYSMFASLRKSPTPSLVDVAGIYDVNKAEEREAFLFHTADETPQTFLAAMTRKDSQSGLRTILQLPEGYGEAKLNMDDFVRLLLTVIAHDLTVSRAQHFLRLLRYISPYLYNASASTRMTLLDGILALGAIFTKAFSKPKGGEFPKPLPEQEEPMVSASTGLENLAKEATRNSSESKTMRMDFLYLVLAVGQAGGTVSPLLASQVIDVTRSLLKDLTESGFQELAVYLDDFFKMLFIREEALGVKGVIIVLHKVAPIFHAFMMVDFTGVFETILRILPVPVYSNDAVFSQVVVGDICTAGLAACDLAISEDRLMDLPYRLTFVALLAEAIFLRDVDIIAELEKRRPTHQLLAGVILPLVLVMKTGAQIIPDSTRTDFHRRMLNNAWIRLLLYSITACRESSRDGGDSSGSSGSVRSKSSDNRSRDFHEFHLSRMAMALQVIKVIIIRGADDISSVTRLGVWERIAGCIHTTLAEGNADFAMKQQFSSTATTPTGSPRSSGRFDNLGDNSGFNLFVSTTSPSESSELPQYRPKLSAPRLVDYCLWSMLEFTCAFRSSLRVHLKLFATEKVLVINKELHRGGRSPGASFQRSPSFRRLSTAIGQRVRNRANTHPLPSPDSSPYLHPSQSIPSSVSSQLSPSPSRLSPSPTMPLSSLLSSPLDNSNMRRPGYAISPVTPHDRAPNWPKIVHLGPTSPSAFLPAPSPLIGLGLRRLSRASNSRADASPRSHSNSIQSEPLCLATYRRIREVQAHFGYRNLLPFPSTNSVTDVDDIEDVFLLTWTKSQAIATVVQETDALLEEFEDSTQNESSSITFDIEPSTPIAIPNTDPLL